MSRSELGSEHAEDIRRDERPFMMMSELVRDFDGTSTAVQHCSVKLPSGIIEPLKSPSHIPIPRDLFAWDRSAPVVCRKRVSEQRGDRREREAESA